MPTSVPTRSQFLRRATGAVPGVVAIPTAVFYDDADAARTLVRFAFCKRREVIEDAARRLSGSRTG